MTVRVYLTRKNLETLLKKLDNPKSFKTIVKRDTAHSEYPLTGAKSVTITAIENEDYYTDRQPGVTMEDFVN